MRTPSYRNPETLWEEEDFVLVREPQAGGPSLFSFALAGIR
jgi:tRNA U34 5-methylaminomethyl-2-thiouridine-forming methyltransferase MnmC